MTTRPPEHLHYQAYLLRFWEIQAQWHFSLEHTQTGTRYYFADVEDLLSFIEVQIKQANQGVDHEPNYLSNPYADDSGPVSGV